MLSKIRFLPLVLLVATMVGGNGASASSHFASGYHLNGGNSMKLLNNGHFWANTGRLQASYRGYSGYSWGYGGFLGYGYGYGYGYPFAYPGWAYELEGVPYFAQFPPIYYGYEDNTPVVKPSIRTTWPGSVPPQTSAAPAESATPPRPLLIVNPYYYETQTEKPKPPSPVKP